VAVRRWLSETGTHADDLLALVPALDADAAGVPLGRLADAVTRVRAAGDPLTLQDLAVNGNDLIAAGVRPGPDVGDALRRLLGEVLEDPRRNTRDYLIGRV
jgi:tRNA nucleotidyltransferase (CCA-adding enzyme)